MTIRAEQCRIVATAGHVDHGKSSLVRALTGMEPDRLEEEQRRGLTIDLGFVWTELPSGHVAAFVDVPGHHRFVRNMIAGVGTTHACLFVVDAFEGWMPQSEEHLQILDLLGTRRGVIALTKKDRVSESRMAGVAREVRDRVDGSFLADALIVGTSTQTGEGLDELTGQLDRLCSASTNPPAGRLRLWIDRSFSVRGTGTVVTGTLTGDAVAVEDRLQVVSSGYRGATCRVRGIQMHGSDLPLAPPGTRTALALSGIGKDSLRRGDCLTQPDEWHLTRRFDARLTVVPSRRTPLRPKGAYLVNVGTCECSAEIQVRRTQSIEPGATETIRLRVPSPLPLQPGDRFLLRDAGRQELVGGGLVLDIDPTHPLATTDAGSPVERTIDTRGWIRAADLHRLTGDTRPPTVGDWIASPSALAETRRRVLDAVDKAGAAGLALNRLSEHERAAVGCFEDVEINGGRVFRQDDDRLAEHLFLEELRAKPFTPPPPDSVKHDELAELVRRGLVLRCDGLYFAATAVELAAELIEPIVVASEGGVTVSEIRTQLGISRKYALALAQLLDREGFTRRNGSLRVAGHALRPRGSDESGDGNPEQPSSLRDPTDDRGRVPGT